MWLKLTEMTLPSARQKPKFEHLKKAPKIETIANQEQIVGISTKSGDVLVFRRRQFIKHHTGKLL